MRGEWERCRSRGRERGEKRDRIGGEGDRLGFVVVRSRCEVVISNLIRRKRYLGF